MAAQFPLPVLTGIGHDKDETVLDLVAHTKLKTPTAVAEFLIACFADFESRLNDLADGIFSGTEDILNDSKNRLVMAISQIKPVTQKRMQEHKFILDSLSKDMQAGVHLRIAEQRNQLNSFMKDLQKDSVHYAKSKSEVLNQFVLRMQSAVTQNIDRSRQLLNKYKLKIDYQNPEKILEKGYSITTKNGSVISKISELEKGDRIVTILSDGRKSSTVD